MGFGNYCYARRRMQFSKNTICQDYSPNRLLFFTWLKNTTYISIRVSHPLSIRTDTLSTGSNIIFWLTYISHLDDSLPDVSTSINCLREHWLQDCLGLKWANIGQQLFWERAVQERNVRQTIFWTK